MATDGSKYFTEKKYNNQLLTENKFKKTTDRHFLAIILYILACLNTPATPNTIVTIKKQLPTTK
jgi:hypothetical protein